MDSTWSFSQTFVPQFQSSCTDLASRIETVRTSSSAAQGLALLGTLSGDLANLKKSLLDATGALPTYDQGQCESRLQALEIDVESLRSSLAPKARFSFKRGPAKQSPSSTSTVSVIAQGESTPTPSSQKPANAGDMPSAGIELSSHSQCYLTLESLPTTSSSFSLAISNLENCIVNLLPSPRNQQESPSSSSPEISALHVRDVRNSMLLIPIIKGSVLLYNLTSCILVVGCHQFRMHNSKRVDIYLSVSSDPVIEDSTEVRFAPYPNVFLTISPGIPSGKPIDDDRFRAQDFSHVKATPSPHWSILSKNERLQWPQELPFDVKELDAIFSRTGFGSISAPEPCS